MFANKVVPILLVAGAVHMIMKHSECGCEEHSAAQPGEGEARGSQCNGGHHGPYGQHGPFGHHAGWANRVPPMFEMWHNRAHAAQNAPQPPSPAPVI
jgi:hypothetical protein